MVALSSAANEAVRLCLSARESPGRDPATVDPGTKDLSKVGAETLGQLGIIARALEDERHLLHLTQPSPLDLPLDDLGMAAYDRLNLRGIEVDAAHCKH